MAVEAERTEAADGNAGTAVRKAREHWRWASVFLARNWFSSLTHRIIVFNLAALVILVSGILYLNQFRAGLVDGHVKGLLTQGQIIAGAIAASATIDTESVMIDPDRLLELQTGEAVSPLEEQISSLDFPINPERAAPILRNLISPTHTRARLYDRDGGLVVDSRNLFASGQILRYDLPPLREEAPSLIETLWRSIRAAVRRGDLPAYRELPPDEGKGYTEVAAALTGASTSIVRVNEKGELIIFVAVPVQRFRAVLGALVLSTQGGDIDGIISAERWAIFRVFLVAAGVTVLLSLLLASTIGEPVRRLAAAAERVRKGVDSRQEIPDFTARRDEIGHLSGALRDMTKALYDRMDAIERFAADVAHELKNPLTSLRSATETLPVARTDADRQRLIEIVQADVRRLDRLISDISAASRLDAELSRQETGPVDLKQLLLAVVAVADSAASGVKVVLEVNGTDGDFAVNGHDLRLGQVAHNLIDNAVSFSPADSTVRVSLSRHGGFVKFSVDDGGPGISPDVQERIFERFYTDRPGIEAFGQNSGLGLSIAKQIVEAHDGIITASNRLGENGSIAGACFEVTLPASRPDRH
ncbi:MAG: HAMP domain-containing protein [Rhizobiales bacterium]|nr:HAMP domain-containing protein [Hyphomicrobiales bacterium]